MVGSELGITKHGGAPSAVYVFVEPSKGWTGNLTQKGKLTHPTGVW